MQLHTLGHCYASCGRMNKNMMILWSGGWDCARRFPGAICRAGREATCLPSGRVQFELGPSQALPPSSKRRASGSVGQPGAQQMDGKWVGRPRSKEGCSPFSSLHQILPFKLSLYHKRNPCHCTY